MRNPVLRQCMTFRVGWRESAAPFTDGDLAEIFIKANVDFDSLSEFERLRLMGGVHGTLKVFEEAFDQYQQRRLVPRSWDAINRQYSSLFSAPLYQRYWEIRRTWYHEDFQLHVDALVRTGYHL
jgi:hypothetical protein